MLPRSGEKESPQGLPMRKHGTCIPQGMYLHVVYMHVVYMI